MCQNVGNFRIVIMIFLSSQIFIFIVFYFLYICEIARIASNPFVTLFLYFFNVNRWICDYYFFCWFRRNKKTVSKMNPM